jgi:hypothetical protein
VFICILGTHLVYLQSAFFYTHLKNVPMYPDMVHAETLQIRFTKTTYPTGDELKSS